MGGGSLISDVNHGESGMCFGPGRCETASMLLCVLLFSAIGGHPAVPPLPLHSAAESSLSTGLFDR